MHSPEIASENKKKQGKLFFLTYFVVIIIMLALGRALSYLCTLSSTDIAYPEWVEKLSSYLSEILDASRRAVSYAAVICAVFSGSGGIKTTFSVSLLALLDSAVRFAIDLFTSAISGQEVLAVIWLGTNYIYELVFIILTYIIARMVMLKRNHETNERKKRSITPTKAVFYSVGLYCLSRLVSELLYLIDFLVSYVNITNTEIASIVGSFLGILVIYGGISFIVAYLFYPVLERRKSPRAFSDFVG